MAEKLVKTRQFYWEAAAWLAWILIFLICNSGHCLIPIIFKHNTKLR